MDMEQSSLKLLIICSYEGEHHVIRLEEGTTLEDLYRNISKRWNKVSIEAVKLQYIAPIQKSYVTLLCDDDVANMWRMHILLKVMFVDMIARCRSEHQSVPLRSTVGRRGEAECSGLNEDCADGIFIPDESTSLIAMQRCIVGEGQTFKGPQEFRKLLKNYCIATQKHFRYQKNDSSKIIAVCIDKGCGWRIYASFHARDASFSIRKCNLHHTCTMSLLQSRDHPAADANWISEVYKDKIRSMPAYKASDIREHIQTDYGIDVKYHKAWRGKENAIRAINGGGRDSFSQLPWYCHALRESNPGSIIDCEVEQATKRFQRLFVCLGACRLGFLRGCRPLLFLDGTHIKNKHKGCLLSAIAVDGDDGMFTLAFSAVSTENDENWEWFCWKLRSVLECEGRTDWKQYTFFSDRHSGLLKSISCVFPGAHHAYCLRHLVDNFRTQVMRRYPMHNKKR
ncbi:uncharacterized protein LOC127244435 [Andrographis paniculata]|uniref:uncharacterized protein LOC127244435 n=1 Tax=Andrographis paniculata TaxID=175694 RepID=UPI0021E7B976|nr:uncharacterized protein LOC127244435 [Andrographis paniculata]